MGDRTSDTIIRLTILDRELLPEEQEHIENYGFNPLEERSLQGLITLAMLRLQHRWSQRKLSEEITKLVKKEMGESADDIAVATLSFISAQICYRISVFFSGGITPWGVEIVRVADTFLYWRPCSLQELSELNTERT